MTPEPFLLEDLIVTSVSHKPEKAVEAPAAVSVEEADEIMSRPAVTPVEHLKALPAVDVFTTGLNQSRVAVRGFNNVVSNSDKLLVLADYRNVQLPSLRINNFQLISSVDEDIERIGERRSEADLRQALRNPQSPKPPRPSPKRSSSNSCWRN